MNEAAGEEEPALERSNRFAMAESGRAAVDLINESRRSLERTLTGIVPRSR